MAKRRVVVTGLGVVTAAGVGIGLLWEGLLAGRSFIRQITGFDASNFPCGIAGEIENFSARNFVPKSYRKSVKVMARDTEIAVAAADAAFRDAGITTRGIDPDNSDVDPKRLGCNIGAGLICTDLDELGSAVNTAVTDGKFDIRLWGQSGMNNLTPLWLLKYLPNMLSCHVTIIHGAEGPSNTITCGETSGHLAVGEAASVVARGNADVVIAGGAETKLNPMGLLRQGLLKRLCTTRNDQPETACRPFDADHDGTVIGEGGGMLILEDLHRASSRGARIYAEIAGFGSACDPEGIDVTRPSVGNLDLAASKAIANAGIGPEEIDLVVAHGTGVPSEDEAECKAWASSLGSSGRRIPASSITGAVGTAFAGSSGVELAMAAMALHTQMSPPTANFKDSHEGCSLDFSGATRQADIRYVISGAFSVGGQSGACVMKRYEP